MKLTFRVWISLRTPSSPRALLTDYCLQDLKQQKFTIEAEPTETVRVPILDPAAPNAEVRG
jgi:hypothetical protein